MSDIGQCFQFSWKWLIVKGLGIDLINTEPEARRGRGVCRKGDAEKDVRHRKQAPAVLKLSYRGSTIEAPADTQSSILRS